MRINRKIAILAMTVLTVGAAHAADLPTFKLEMNDGKLNPARIEVPAGQRIKIEVRNTGKGAAEFESVQLRKEKVLAPGARFVRRDRTAVAGRVQVLRRFPSAGAGCDRREVRVRGLGRERMP